MRFDRLLHGCMAALAITTLSILRTATAIGQPTSAELMSAYQELREVSIDSSRIVEVDSLVLEKDVARLTFHSGRLYFLHPVMDRITGAVFVGEGTFTLNPTQPI